MRGEVRASHGVVAAGRTFTVDAGARLMSAGGNAIDGGVAVDLRRGGRRDLALRSRRRGPHHHLFRARQARRRRSTARDRRRRRRTRSCSPGKDAIPGNGPLGATLPAAVDSAAIALAKYGTKSLSDVLQPAIELADGFPMYEFLHHYLETERAACEPYAWTMRTYYPDGRITPVGEMFRQPNLAATLRALAAAEQAALARGASREQAIEAGRDAFYKGPIARDMTAAVREAGGVMTDDDLAGYHGKIEEPASAPYRGYTVYKAGFWNQGPALLQTLRILEGFDLAAMGAGSADALHTTVEAIKLAYADRDRYYGDPDFVRVPGDVLLSAPYAALRRALIDPKHASLEQRPGDPARGDRAAANFRRSGATAAAAGRQRAEEHGRHDVDPGRGRRRQPVLRDAELGLAARRRVRRRRDRRADEQPDAGVQSRSVEPERARRRQAAADDADADRRPQGRQAVPRHRHARRRQPGSADPARAAQHHGLRDGRAGRDRGAARQLAASRQLVRQSPRRSPACSKWNRRWRRRSSRS